MALTACLELEAEDGSEWGEVSGWVWRTVGRDARLRETAFALKAALFTEGGAR